MDLTAVPSLVLAKAGKAVRGAWRSFTAVKPTRPNYITIEVNGQKRETYARAVGGQAIEVDLAAFFATPEGRRAAQAVRDSAHRARRRRGP